MYLREYRIASGAIGHRNTRRFPIIAEMATEEYELLKPVEP